MDTEYPYKTVENKLQNIQQEQELNMDQVNGGPPPMYNNYPQVLASSTASVPSSTVQIIPMTNQPIFSPPVGPKSMQMTCPSCRCRIETAVRHRFTSKTHYTSFKLAWICCCCLPYCMDSYRNANHFCPQCRAFIGTYST